MDSQHADWQLVPSSPFPRLLIVGHMMNGSCDGGLRHLQAKRFRFPGVPGGSNTGSRTPAQTYCLNCLCKTTALSSV